jgi:hypothetical protein
VSGICYEKLGVEIVELNGTGSKKYWCEVKINNLEKLKNYIAEVILFFQIQQMPTLLKHSNTVLSKNSNAIPHRYGF